jgi:hypothetical protein
MELQDLKADIFYAAETFRLKEGTQLQILNLSLKEWHGQKEGTYSYIPEAYLRSANPKFLLAKRRKKIRWILLKVHTVGAQSIARLCQNLVNCRGNIFAHRRRRKLRFFLFKRSSAGE